MVDEDTEVEHPHGSMYCSGCNEFFRRDSKHIKLRKFGDEGYFSKEEYYCQNCSEELILSDQTSIFDVDGNRQICPDCESTAIQLIPFASVEHEFTGAKFICRACGKMDDLELEL